MATTPWTILLLTSASIIRINDWIKIGKFCDRIIVIDLSVARILCPKNINTNCIDNNMKNIFLYL